MKRHNRNLVTIRYIICYNFTPKRLQWDEACLEASEARWQRRKWMAVIILMMFILPLKMCPPHSLRLLRPSPALPSPGLQSAQSRSFGWWLMRLVEPWNWRSDGSMRTSHLLLVSLFKNGVTSCLKEYIWFSNYACFYIILRRIIQYQHKMVEFWK